MIGEPKVVKQDDDGKSVLRTGEGYDAEKERLAEMGKPRLGIHMML